MHGIIKITPINYKICFNPKTVFWTNVGKIVDLFLKITSLDLYASSSGRV